MSFTTLWSPFLLLLFLLFLRFFPLALSRFSLPPFRGRTVSGFEANTPTKCWYKKPQKQIYWNIVIFSKYKTFLDFNKSLLKQAHKFVRGKGVSVEIPFNIFTVIYNFSWIFSNISNALKWWKFLFQLNFTRIHSIKF